MVTGGRGFVGGWLCKALLERGETVISLDRRSVGERPSSLEMLGIEGELAQVEAELTDAAAVGRALDAHRVDAVYHLAAETIVAGVADSPARGFDSNVRGTWTVLERCRDRGVERVVVASSDKAYGAHDDLPYREEFPLRPTAPYEASKAAADLIARSYWPSYGLPVAVTRFANV
jgi:CDP-glucose 4,6-dehydratase